MRINLATLLMLAVLAWPMGVSARELWISMPHFAEEVADVAGSMTVTVDMQSQPTKWPATQTELSVFVAKMQAHQAQNTLQNQNDALFNSLPEKDPAYDGVIVNIITRDGRTVEPIRVFEGRITGTSDNRLLKKDPGRALEYWLMGTAKIVKQQLLATQVLPVFTFDQCRLLGSKIVETTPRQCLMADNNLVFDVPERPTKESLKITDFESCLEKGKAIIHTFPRRCMADGGRVFTEPPKLRQQPRFTLTQPVGDVLKGQNISGTILDE